MNASLQIDAEALRPLIATIIDEMMVKHGPVSEPIERMYSEPEAAALFCVDPHVLRDARKRGELEAHRIGKFVRYDRQQLEAWKERTKIN